MTFFSGPFYRDLARNGKGLGFVYMLLLLFVCWAIISVRIFFLLQGSISGKESEFYVDQLPTMTLAGGKLSIDKASPCFIKDKDGKVIAAFDTSGKTTTLDAAGGAKILVTEDSFITEKESGAQETVPLKSFQTDFKFGPTDIKGFIDKIPLYLSVFVWLWGFFVWLGHLISALLYGVVGLIMDKSKLGYATAVRVGSFAMTPVILISTIKDIAVLNVPFWPLICMVITLAYMYFAYTAINQEQAA